MKSERVKKTLEKSKNVLEEKREMVKQKNLQKTNACIIIAMNCVQEQLKTARDQHILLSTRKSFHV